MANEYVQKYSVLLIKDMQVKTTIHNDILQLLIWQLSKTVLTRMWTKRNPCILLEEIQTGATIMENIKKFHQKIKNISAV
jgi:hypothetical protein